MEPKRKKQKFNIPNVISPSIISLFETLANECVRHIAFRIDKHFYTNAKQNINGWKTIGENTEYIRSAPGRILGVDVETIETVTNKRQLARLSIATLPLPLNLISFLYVPLPTYAPETYNSSGFKSCKILHKLTALLIAR